MKICDYCGMPAELVTGQVIYPEMPKLHKRRFWHCQDCAAWVGCHKGTTEPLGRLADAELRKAKQQTHDVFDRLWKTGKLTRSQAYAKLAAEMGIDPEFCHIGMFDVGRCQQAREAAREILKQTGTGQPWG